MDSKRESAVGPYGQPIPASWLVEHEVEIETASRRNPEVRRRSTYVKIRTLDVSPQGSESDEGEPIKRSK